ncbi:divalent-cation tolerance protein CutA [Halorhodospira abdelmalekii]|nr:divalent-cation tolerance protein CutA [Halorhodospira abdelmalekii]
MASLHYVVLCTCPDQETARRLAGGAVEASLAACVNIVSGISSVFYWEGAVQEEAEWLLVIKTSDVAYSELESYLQANHPYDLPEIIACPIEKGLSGFLEWISAETRHRPRSAASGKE